MQPQVHDLCPSHGTPARKEYEFGGMSPQPRITVYSGCKCARFDCEMPGGYEEKLFPSYSEAEGAARMALAIWAAS